jgi:glycosyltransferase involved in cell wall biosynthesis
LIEKFLARFATDKIVVISSQQFSEICDRFGVGKKERFALIPLGVDLRPFADPVARRSSFREEIGASDADILIGFVGRLTEIKNISLLLQSAARIRDTRPADEPDI